MAITPTKVFAIAIGIYFLAALLPDALSNFFSTDTTGWDAGSAALWGLIPLAIIGVLVYAYMPRGGNA